MALIEQTMTEKNLEAHRRNGPQSHGAATPEGKERARAANLRHGCYSQLRDQALVALGEDPEDLAALVEAARRQFRPANGCQEWITERLASLQFRMLRAERQQESKMAAHIRQFEARRRERAQELRFQLTDMQDFLHAVQHAVARPDFYAPPGCFARCADVAVLNPTPSLEQILRLLHRLRQPRCFTTPAPPPLPAAMSDREWQEALNDDTYDESAVPHPEIPIAEGRERDPLREELYRLVVAEERAASTAWQEATAEQEAPLTPRRRDLLAAEVYNDKAMEPIRREEERCAREFSSLANKLMQLQKEAVYKPNPKQPDQAAEAQSSAAVRNEGTDKTAKNEGASGYVEENTEGPLQDGDTTPPRYIMQAENDGRRGGTF
jgi:hypothetical protein